MTAPYFVYGKLLYLRNWSYFGLLLPALQIAQSLALILMHSCLELLPRCRISGQKEKEYSTESLCYEGEV